MTERRRDIVLDASLIEQDLQQLFIAAEQNPRGRERNLLNVALQRLKAIKDGARSTHPLEYLSTYPDLSDCETTYVGIDPDAKPSHRIVWREIVPEDPHDPIIRQAIAMAPRDHGAAYYIAGQRLGRPVGFTLSELSTHPEPIARRSLEYATAGPEPSYEPEL